MLRFLLPNCSEGATDETLNYSMDDDPGDRRVARPAGCRIGPVAFDDPADDEPAATDAAAANPTAGSRAANGSAAQHADAEHRADDRRARCGQGAIFCAD
jgi:hypothetical protein